MRFLGNVLATIIGLFVFCMISFFGILLIGALFGGNAETVYVESNSVIELDLSQVNQDYAGKFNYKDFDYFDARHDGLSDVIKAIKAAKNDNDIKGISILNNESQLGMAQIKAVRKALEDFKKSGKFVWAYGNTFSQKEYYLNSVANTIYMNPIGEMEFKGLSSELLFFKDFQDKYGIKMEVIRHGKYKSAVEPFLENKMSEANREQISALLNSIWNSMLNDISVSRKIPVSKLNEVANQLGARSPDLALSQHLVDKVVYEDVYHDDIRRILKVDKDEDYHRIKILDYAQNIASTSSEFSSKNKIAIIYAQGEIGSGEGDVNMVGEGSMRRALQDARKDDKTKAIVLRIDSPGGSALTSDLIWREIEVTKKVKPVIVSMGNVAASGGYYIACNANRIFAENNTITGSIGVFGLLPNFTSLTTKMGINSEQVSTNQNAADYSVFRPLADNYRFIAQEGVEKIYTTFVNRVATGRKMTFQQVDAIAQGRVWSGAEAVKIGLVDQLGGLDDALNYAAELVKTKNYKTQNLPIYEKNFEDWLSERGFPFLKTRESFIKEELGEENYKVIEQIRRVQSKKGVQAALPFELNIH
ncbi:signal peptide peptidase SppA [Flavobacterium sp. CYK-4]|uniref:signal peptide peptidase SppA n=1 Tax=Flavobacterium lotistagni TaxID=2709660 RepID=UPI00140902D7|nr:signal peptide peptidase SppA [Flavobacterium lotistagni]NHM08293.1 signal peptide peptidase SppA [Flavobacterium lotistagni]